RCRGRRVHSGARACRTWSDAWGVHERREVAMRFGAAGRWTHSRLHEGASHSVVHGLQGRNRRSDVGTRPTCWYLCRNQAGAYDWQLSFALAPWVIGELNRDPLEFVERDFITGAVVELGGAGTFMRRHGLRVFERAAGFEIGGIIHGVALQKPRI